MNKESKYWTFDRSIFYLTRAVRKEVMQSKLSLTRLGVEEVPQQSTYQRMWKACQTTRGDAY